MDLLDDLLGRLDRLPEEDRARIEEDAGAFADDLKWIPNPGPQTDAYFSEADIVLYGGQAAGGKSDLLAGLALTKHRRSLLMRRQYTDLGAMIERVRQVDGSYTGFNGSPPPKLRTQDGRLIDFGAAAKVGDEQHWQGQPHDFLGIDEAVHFLESQVRFLMGWVRSAEPGQRVRTVLATNPPVSAEGDWIIGMFRPWLDMTHHNPAKPGETRYFVTDPEGKDFEVTGPSPHLFPGQEKPVIPHTRTFITASLNDNPFLKDTGYAAQLDALPEPLRSAVRDGNFMASREDDEWQICPTEWIRAAQTRWTPNRPEGVPMSSIAADPASGGKDRSVISYRYDAWFAPLVSVPGAETPNGTGVAGLIIKHRKDDADVTVDMGGGYGGVPYTTLEENGVPVHAYKGAERSNARTADRKLGFFNKRSETYWRFREALDPDLNGGSGVCLPDSQGLLSELSSVRYSTVIHKGVLCIKAETKEDVVKRLGHSPDEADAVVMCWARGDATEKGQIIPKDQRIGRGGRMPKTVTSRDKRR